MPKLDDGNSKNAFSHASAEKMCRINIYFQGLDTILQNLKLRFSEKECSKITQISDLLFNLENPINETIANDI